MAIQDYIDHALNALPVWFSDNVRAFETITAFAVLFDRAQSQMEFWHDMTLIQNADGGPPDWLNQHGIDRTLRRQDGETNEAYRARIVAFSENLTTPSVLALVQSIIDAEGIIGTVFMFGLKANRGHFGNFTSASGVDITFADGPGADQVLLSIPGLLNPAKLPLFNQDKFAISGAASAGNDGTFVIEGVVGNDYLITNASAVFEADATAAWDWEKYDVDDNLRDGFGKSYMSRGYRIGDNNPALVVILPFGCTEATRLSVQQALLDNTGAGIQSFVECRANP